MINASPLVLEKAQKNVPLKKPKPPFKYSKVSDDLILRRNPNVVLRSDQYGTDKASKIPHCYCVAKKANSANSQMIGNWLAETYQDGRSIIQSKGEDHKDTCSLCTIYDGYFVSPRLKKQNAWISSRKGPPKLCSYCKQNFIDTYHTACRNRSPCKSDVSDGSRKRVCFCPPTEKSNSSINASIVTIDMEWGGKRKAIGSHMLNLKMNIYYKYDICIGTHKSNKDVSSKKHT
ncbi:hypothetical protein JTB14_009411 [Gonioctena quinquepunctata]|nr:hypothetical protein JTB14_009411 [Gonioctena quinquepunctata]